jgi:hypothetical protein
MPLRGGLARDGVWRDTMKKVWAALLVLCVAGAEAPARGDEEEQRTLYFFFSEKTSSAPEAAKAIVAFLARNKGEVALRPALLVEDWSTFLKVGEASPLYLTMRQLGKATPIQIFDEEALKLAQAWKITRLPALVLVAHGRAHVLQGGVIGLEELLGCSR